ncbi:membrane protein insertase YidC [Corynebacterium alimapuense]|uniref:membrane protein insertase YidC n=1 Tax=Corynebacterium alimapuense TaxID=1576874 RepID=UPI001402B112|nr:membrane protein insertase YidC [Corynebacterium alimapuense]
MLDPFIYFVSGVLKLWHLLLQDVLGADYSLTWALSLFGLVVTVRILIAPFTWIQLRSSRTTVRMRPELTALNEEFQHRTDKESVAQHQQRRKELQKRYNYRPAAGCLPMLIQIPVFLGLYRVVLSMSRPTESLQVAADFRVGFLTAPEINSFLNAEFNGVPLPAYVAMSTDQLSSLGTTAEEVLGLVLPTLLLAVAFTVLNLSMSLYFSSKTLDWGSPAVQAIRRFQIGLTIFVPVILLSLGLLSPLPVAIILYWFANNLWTLAQSLTFQLMLNHRMPLDEAYQAHHKKQRDTARETNKEKRTYRASVRRRKALGVIKPWRIPEIRRELIAEKTEKQVLSAAEKAKKKELFKAKQASRRALNQEKIARRRAEREAKKAGDSTPADADTEETRLSNPPEEQATSDEPDPGQSPKD